jgi:hypothetical protein
LKEKALVNWFALGNVLDILTTFLFLSRGWGTELNPLAKQMMVDGNMVNLLILKIAYAAVLIGAYALAKSTNSRWLFPTEKALQLGILILWSVQVWNLINLVAAMA